MQTVLTCRGCAPRLGGLAVLSDVSRPRPRPSPRRSRHPPASVLAGRSRRRGDGRRPSAPGRPLRAVMRDHPLDQATRTAV